jgi:hypothetical protein
MDSSSNTDRRIFSAFGSSSSLRECTSDRPSSWGQWMVLQHNLVSTRQILFGIDYNYYTKIQPYNQQQALSFCSKVLNIFLHNSYSLYSDNIK